MTMLDTWCSILGSGLWALDADGPSRTQHNLTGGNVSSQARITNSTIERHELWSSRADCVFWISMEPHRAYRPVA